MKKLKNIFASINYWLLWRRIENVVFFTIVAIVLLYFLLQSAAVQNWLIQKAVDKLESDLQTEVAIESIGIRFFDRVALQGVFIEDQQGDTLIYVGDLEAGLRGNFFSVFFQKLEFDQITLRDAQINLIRRKGEYDKSIQFLLDYFKGPPKPKEPKKEPSPFFVSVQNLNLVNVRFLEIDAKGGRDIDIGIKRGNLRIKRFDRQKYELLAPAFTVSGFEIIVTEYPKNPLPERETVEQEPPPAAAVSLPLDSIIEYVKPFFTARIDNLDLSGGYLVSDQNRSRPERLDVDTVMDYKHLVVRDIALRVKDFVGNEDLAFSGDIEHFAASEDCGFQVKHGEAKNVVLTDKKAIFNDLLIQTDNSDFGGLYEMHYETYKDIRDRFETHVRINAEFRPDSKVSFRDIMYFSPPVNRNTFFQKNKSRVAQLSGKITGRINDLSGRDMVLKIGNKGYVGGRFDFNDIVDGRFPSMRFVFSDLRTDMQTIRDVIPGFSAPEYFDRLGQISTDSAFYDIFFFTDHLVGGRFKTDLGKGGVDLKLAIPEGRDQAVYSGNLEVENFDLRTWTGNPEFGNTSFSIRLDESKGLSKNTVDASLKGFLHKLDFRGFSYENIAMNGHFKGPTFDGDLKADAAELRFDFAGKVDFSDSLPNYSFQANVKRLDLKALQLLEKDWIVSGKVDYLDLQGNKLDNLQGRAFIRDFRLLQDSSAVHSFDSLAFSLAVDSNDYHTIVARSELFDMDMKGLFRPQRLQQDLLYFFEKSYPEYAANLGIEIPQSLRENPPQSQFDLEFNLKTTKSFLQLAGLGKDTLEQLSFHGFFDIPAARSEFYLRADSMKYGKVRLREVDLTYRQLDSRAFYSVFIGQSDLGKYKQGIVDVSGTFIANNLTFDILHQNANSALRSVTLKGSLSAMENKNWILKFIPSNIQLFSDTWQMADNNSVTFGNGSFATSEFELFSNIADKRIRLSSQGQRGLLLTATNFDLSFLDNFLKIKDVTYQGNINDVDLRIEDVFAMKGMELFLGIDSFSLKNQYYGFFQANLSMADAKSPVVWTSDLLDFSTKHALHSTGAYLIGGSEAMPVSGLGLVRPKEFQMDLEAERFPLDVLQQFIPGISETKGQLNGRVRMGGPFSKVNMDGLVYIDSASVKLDYLQTSFTIDHQPVQLNNFQIWAQGDTIYDAEGDNMAFVRGGLRHNHFKGWEIDCGVTSADNRFKILDTKRGDNDLFYGTGIGRVSAEFSGTFVRTNMAIRAETGRGTSLKLPLDTEEDAAEVSFIKFKNKTEQEEKKEDAFDLGDLKGIELEITLSITEDAEILIILDEKAGDIVEGKGTGNILMAYDRGGNFTMNGSYTIRSGKYLFTLMNFVNKPFKVEEGGTINWFGDPYGAQIDLRANYDVNASLYNFLQTDLEAQGNENLIRQAQQSTEVVLSMDLSGALFTPDIAFSFRFPEVVGELKSLTENKIRLLEQDPNEVNRQVFALVVMGAFMPSSDNGFIQSSLAAPVVNTFTQFLTSQFSNYLTGLAAEWFGGRVSSLDFDIAYNEYTNALGGAQGGGGTNAGTLGRELQVRFSSGFNNDRVVVNFGSQFALGGRNLPGSVVQDGFLGEDVTVEIALTANRQWRLKVYQRLEPDITGGSFRWRFGGGISFQKDYDSFTSMMRGLGGVFKRK